MNKSPKSSTVGLALVCLMAIAMQTSGGLCSLTSLFSRPGGLFQVRPAGNQVNAAPNQQVAGERLLLAANSMAPAFGPHFGQMRHSDLLRLNAANQQPQPQVSSFASNHFDSRAAYLKPSALTLHPLADFPQVAEGAGPFGRLEPQQSEVVDKIERHIGQQIEQSLVNQGAQLEAASGYAQPQHQRQQPESKQTAASGEESEEAEEPAEAEKRHEHHEHHHEHHHEPKKEPEEKHHEQHEHHEHHHESPPEAFEVHHKKGGKSFQYFHQGHKH